MAKELTEQQKRFCEEYVIDLNAKQAAIRAGYSEKTAEQQASRLLRIVKVKEYIDDIMKDIEKRTKIRQEAVVKELAAVAFAHMSDYVRVVEKQELNESGKTVTYKTLEYTLTKDLTSTQKKAIASTRYGKTGIVVTLYDKMKALELLGRHLGMFKEKLEISAGIEDEKTKLDEIISSLSGGDA